MKIYVLLKQGYEGSETVCVSEDINKIRTSICEDFNPNEDYPELEIWRNGEMRALTMETPRIVRMRNGRMWNWAMK